LLLFCITANISAANSADSSKEGKVADTNGESVKLKFPRFIRDPKKFAMELLEICKNKKKPPSDYNVINDKQVDFKNCTFICKHGRREHVTLDLPKETPCGPSGQVYTMFI
uniref:Uncharacterized protein n=2 Tax=Ixodes scapularis TaxID=6945 RepID=A0A1S4M6B4_IXOSC